MREEVRNGRDAWSGVTPSPRRRRSRPSLQHQVPDGSTVQVNGKGDVAVTLPGRQPLSKAWLDKAAGLKPEEQVRAVVAELQRRNPGFDGKHAARIRGGDVRIFGVVTDHISDISPVRGLRGLFSLTCLGSGWGKGRLSDLSPLAGTGIEKLDIGWTAVADLTPLRGCLSANSGAAEAGSLNWPRSRE